MIWDTRPRPCARCGMSFDEGCTEECLDRAIQTRIDEMASPEVEKLIEELEDELVLIERRALMCKAHPELGGYGEALTDCAHRIRRVLAGKKNDEHSGAA